MLKSEPAARALDTEIRAVCQLRQLLEGIPWVGNLQVERPEGVPDRGADAIAMFVANDRIRFILCEVKSEGQPRHARNAVNQLKSLKSLGSDGALMVIAA